MIRRFEFKNKKKRILKTVAFSVMMTFSCISAFASSGLSGDFKYKVTPEDKKWSEFESKKEMVDACKIQSEVLSEMTTEEVVNAVLEYPLLINIYAYDSYEDGLEALAKDSDAFRELLKRPDASEKLMSLLEDKPYARSLGIMDKREGSLEDLSIRILLSKTSKKEADFSKSSEVMALRSGTSTVRTPNGTAVGVTKLGEELSSYQKKQMEESIKETYPNAKIIRSATSNYNCHSYAWHSTSSRNKYWMDNPDAYMTDGSYSRLDNLIYANSSTRMYYPGEHSAIVKEAGGPLVDPKYLKVKSKWGRGPLMEHVAEYSPYSSDDITLWVAN